MRKKHIPQLLGISIAVIIIVLSRFFSFSKDIIIALCIGVFIGGIVTIVTYECDKADEKIPESNEKKG